MGLKALVQAVTGKSDPAEAAAVLKADPNKLIDLEQRTLELENDAMKAELADRQDARHSMVSLAQANSGTVWGPVIISAIVLVGFFTCLLMLFGKGAADLSANQSELLHTLFGALVPMAAAVVAFWMGSSHQGTKAQDALAALPAQTLPWLAKK